MNASGAGAIYSGTPLVIKYLVAIGVLLLVNQVAPTYTVAALLLVGLYLIVTHAAEVGALVQSATDTLAGAYSLAPSGGGGSRILPGGKIVT